MLIAKSSFERAARNLACRYKRRFPNGRRWDATSIKDRWYRRRTCEFVRQRLDGADSIRVDNDTVIRQDGAGQWWGVLDDGLIGIGPFSTMSALNAALADVLPDAVYAR